MRWLNRNTHLVGRSKAENNVKSLRRLNILAALFGLFLFIIVAKVFYLQVVVGKTYNDLAAGQQEIWNELFPVRGEIYVSELKSKNIYPIASNRDYAFVYAEPALIKDKEGAARKIAGILGLDEAELLQKFSKEKDFYEPVKHEVTDELVSKIKKEKLDGIKFSRETKRFYSEPAFGGKLTGFWGYSGEKLSGLYGLEGYFEKVLSGKAGFVEATKDALGAVIPTARKIFSRAKDGDNLILSIDRNIEAFVCDAVRRGQEKYGAESGLAIVMNPENGEILALCASPDFNPNEYGKVEDMNLFSHPAVSDAYEPGSVMKSITMAVAIEEGKVSPETTYLDEGAIKVGGFTIKNSDGKKNGIQTMTQVLEKSLNTGAVFAARKIGANTFNEYMKNLGFGSVTNLELSGEVSGNISQLKNKSEIYLDTASFGQGIMITPTQLITAYSALANGGYLVRPHLLKERRRADNVIAEDKIKPVRQIFSARTSKLISVMLESVVKNGHGKAAGVSGYSISGKTGTAEIPRKDGRGYEENAHIGTFVGYAPTDSPRFVILTRFTRPQNVEWAESSAAPVFGEIAKFLLNYLEIPPAR